MRRAIRIGLFITFCWVSGNVAGLQPSPAPTSKPGPNNPVPTPIPLSEIAPQAQSAMESLRQIQASLSSDRITPSIEERLPHLTKEIELRAEENAKLLTASLPFESLQRMGVVFEVFRDELSTVLVQILLSVCFCLTSGFADFKRPGPRPKVPERWLALR